MHTAKILVGYRPLPRGSKLLGYVDHHPSDFRAGCIIQFGDRPPVWWDGDSTRSLPPGWQSRCNFTPA